MNEEERNEQIKRLVQQGIDRRDAELRVVDLDLWIADPMGLYGLEGEDAVEQWADAARYARAQVEMVSHYVGFSDAVKQLVFDAQDRAQEALRRASARLGEAG
jgi:hypothetical protein